MSLDTERKVGGDEIRAFDLFLDFFLTFPQLLYRFTEKFLSNVKGKPSGEATELNSSPKFRRNYFSSLFFKIAILVFQGNIEARNTLTKRQQTA